MTSFYIDTTDIGAFVNQLDIKSTADYAIQKNAAGNKRVDLVNSKRTITVGIITLKETDFDTVSAALKFNSKLSFRNPKTHSIETNVDCILPENNISYYTIQNGNNVRYKGMTLVYEEL